MEAEDGRHDVPPPPKGPGDASRMPNLFAEREQRETDRRREKAADVRATALELAVQLWSSAELEPADGENIYTIADNMVRYIETGEHPA